MKEAELANFADDNNIYVASKGLHKLTNLLGKESEVAITWFKENNVVLYLEKFQAIIITRQNKSYRNSILKINNVEHKHKNCVPPPPFLLGIQINDKLNFEKQT